MNPDKLGEAARLIAEGAIEEGLRLWSVPLSETHLPADIYDLEVKDLADVASESGQARIAAHCLEYLLDQRAAEAAWKAAADLRAVARCQARSGRSVEAASSYDRSSDHARAAVCWEEADVFANAVRSWERAANAYGSSGDGYRHALAKLNHGSCRLSREERPGRQVLFGAAALLEEEADRAEGRRDIDRALACFHSLIHIGRLTQSHENLSEGFSNCIRLMQQADHPFFVLQYFHDYAEASMQAGEHHAAAEVMREASAWCRRRGMLYSEHFLERAAIAFEAAAEGYVESGAPIELAENALLAALDCHNRRGDAAKVLEVYRGLADLPLSEARRVRYHELARLGIEDARDAPGPSLSWRFRGYYDEETAYPPTWRSDLLNAGGGSGDLLETISEAVGDRGVWDVVRRRCLLVCLKRLERPGWLDEPEAVAEMVSDIARIGSPLSVEPLIKLFELAPPAVRGMVVEATRQLSFARSLELVRLSLDDHDEMVRALGVETLRYMAFPAAFPALVRLFRDDDSPDVRGRIALTLGRLVGLDQRVSRDALDFILHALRDGGSAEIEEDLRFAIGANAGTSSLVTLEHHMAAEPPGRIRDFLERVISRIETSRISSVWELGG